MVALTNQAGRTGERSERRAGGQQKQRHREKKKHQTFCRCRKENLSSATLLQSPMYYINIQDF